MVMEHMVTYTGLVIVGVEEQQIAGAVRRCNVCSHCHRRRWSSEVFADHPKLQVGTSANPSKSNHSIHLESIQSREYIER